MMRRLAAVLGLWLATVAAVASVAAASAWAAPAAASPSSCAGVSVSVVFNQLGGGRRTTCVPHAGDAARVFADAGFRLGYQPDMQSFVCTVDGRPADHDCTSGTAYWSLWWSQGDAGWTYATLGVQSLEVSKGDSLAFVWHQGSGRAAPPALPVRAPASGARVAPVTGSDAGGRTGTTWLAIGAAVVVLGAAAAVPLLRRRRG